MLFTCRYYQLDTSKTVKECLANKTIVEFPTLHVVLPDKTAGYITCDQDETCAMVTESLEANRETFCEIAFTSVLQETTVLHV